MPRSFHAAGCVGNTATRKNLNEHIWISAELLFDAFRRFTCRQRRYGSNVPGPLEARRRAARRKNTNLAHHDFGTPPFDPAIAFGSPASNPGWQSQPKQVNESSARLLPQWLFDAPQKTSQTPAINSKSNAPSKLERRTSVAEFSRQLEKCSTLDSIRTQINTLQLNLRAEPHLAQVALNRLTGLYWSHPKQFGSALLDFLSDPELNPPGSQNHLLILQQLGQGRQMSEQSWHNYMLPAYRKAIALGLIAANDLQHIILNLPQYFQSSGLTSRLENGLPLLDWQQILDSVQKCQVLNMADLDGDFVAKWLQQLDTVSLSPDVTRLIWALHDKINASDSKTFYVSLLARLRHSGVASGRLLLQIKSSIRALPAKDRGFAVLSASQRLLAGLLDGHVLKKEVDLWHQMLTKLDSEICGLSGMAPQTWKKLSAPGISPSNIQHLTALAWTVSSLSNPQLKGASDLPSRELRDQLRKIYQSLENPNMLHDIAMHLAMLSLPGKDKLYQYLSSMSDSNLVSLFDLKDYQDAMQKFMLRDVRIFDDDKFHHWAMQNSRHELTDVAERVTDDLPSLSNFCQLLAMNDKRRLKIIRRILEHSMTMKIRVSRWAGHSALRRSVKNQVEVKVYPDTNEAVEFINRLALSIAVSPVIEPRSAFRNVQYLYNWLQRYGAAILPPISRALWHSGVSRYGKQGCPVAQMQWCLKKVEEIEGSEVKEMLLGDPQYKQRWVTEMETLRSHLIESNRKMMKQILENGRGCPQTRQTSPAKFVGTDKARTATK